MIKLVLIGCLGLISLTWFTTTQQRPVNNNLPKTEERFSVKQLDSLETIAQFDVSEDGQVLGITQNGDLWNLTHQTKLAENLSPAITLAAQNQQIAAGDQNGNLWLWSKQQAYSSQIPLAEKAGLLPIAGSVIAVTKTGDTNHLIRAQIVDNQLTVAAKNPTPLLPDAQPLQANLLNGPDHQGGIIVLAQPNDSRYHHGVLGDDIEATELLYLDKGTLSPQLQALTSEQLVFEDNKATFFQDNHFNSYLVAILSGNGAGARTALITADKGKLVLTSQSQALPSQRWQSPFVFNKNLYAVLMPHLRQELVSYHQDGEQLLEHSLATGVSNHAIGSHQTNLAAATTTFAVLPQTGYQKIAILTRDNRLIKLTDELPAPIRQTKASQDKVYLLLENGQLWTVEHES